ncbi:MAG: hypothetical protein ACXVSL_00580 [Solirubrobacteraceae bacterium]
MAIPLGEVEFPNECEPLAELLDRDEVMAPRRAGRHYEFSFVAWESIEPQAAP